MRSDGSSGGVLCCSNDLEGDHDHLDDWLDWLEQVGDDLFIDDWLEHDPSDWLEQFDRSICELTVWNPTGDECEAFVASYGCYETYGALCPDQTVALPEGADGYPGNVPVGATLSQGCPVACRGHGSGEDHWPGQPCSTQADCDYEGCSDKEYTICDVWDSDGPDQGPDEATYRCIYGETTSACAGKPNGYGLDDGSWCWDGRRDFWCPERPEREQLKDCGGFNCYDGAHIPGHDITCESGMTEKECAELCCDESGCFGFDFSEEEGGRCCTSSISRANGPFEFNGGSYWSCEKNSVTFPSDDEDHDHGSGEDHEHGSGDDDDGVELVDCSTPEGVLRALYGIGEFGHPYRCRTWGAVPCSPDFFTAEHFGGVMDATSSWQPPPELTGYAEVLPFSATDPTEVDFCMTEQALECRRACHTCGTACDWDVPGSVRSACPPDARRAARGPSRTLDSPPPPPPIALAPPQCPEECGDPTMCPMSDGSFQPNNGNTCEDEYPDEDHCTAECISYLGCINCPAPVTDVKDCSVEDEFSSSAPRRPNPRPGPLGAPFVHSLTPPTARLAQS